MFQFIFESILSDMFEATSEITGNFNSLADNYGGMDNALNAIGYSVGKSGFEDASIITDAADFTFSTTEQGVNGLQRLSNWASGTNSDILNAGQLGKGLSKGFAIVSALITIGEGVENGWQPHNTADLGIDGIIYGIGAMSGPVGWILAGGWFIGNLIYENSHDNNTITQDMFDHK